MCSSTYGELGRTDSAQLFWTEEQSSLKCVGPGDCGHFAWSHQAEVVKICISRLPKEPFPTQVAFLFLMEATQENILWLYSTLQGIQLVVYRGFFFGYF